MKIGIAGAGLLGQLLAFKLSQLQHTVTLYDPSDQPSAAMTAAGMIAPFTELEKSPRIIADLGLKSLAIWPKILAELKTPIYFRHQGSLVAAHTQDAAELDFYVEKIKKAYPGDFYQPVSQARIAELEPDLGHLKHLLYFPQEGQVDNQSLMRALKKINVRCENESVVKLAPHEITLAHRTDRYDWVIDCRGLGATDQFSDLRGVRGELIWLHAEAVSISRPVRLLHPRYSIYVVPRPDQVYIVGASEIEAEDYTPISVRSMLELLSSAYSLHKGFIEARIIHTATNCRPTLTDGLPQIQYAKGILAINGLYRHGFLLAPALIEDISQFLQRGEGALCYQPLWKEIND